MGCPALLSSYILESFLVYCTKKLRSRFMKNNLIQQSAFAKGLTAVFSTNDRLAKLILCLHLPVVAYLLLLPLLPSIKLFALEKSHLRTENFFLWAITQPIPAMYSFEHRFELYTQDTTTSSNEPMETSKIKEFLGAKCSALDGKKLSGFRTHYPGGLFSNVYYHVPFVLRKNKQYEVILRSKYHSESIESLIQLHINQVDDGCPPKETKSTITRKVLK